MNEWSNRSLNCCCLVSGAWYLSSYAKFQALLSYGAWQSDWRSYGHTLWQYCSRSCTKMYFCQPSTQCKAALFLCVWNLGTIVSSIPFPFHELRNSCENWKSGSRSCTCMLSCFWGVSRWNLCFDMYQAVQSWKQGFFIDHIVAKERVNVSFRGTPVSWTVLFSNRTRQKLATSKATRSSIYRFGDLIWNLARKFLDLP